jgi:hypothetical protein
MATITGGVVAYDAATDSGGGAHEATVAEAAAANAGTGRNK